MSKKLYVGNLPWSTTDEDLHEAFSRFGEVAEAKVIRDRDTGRSRGFGFVTYDDPAQAEKAMSEMDNAQLDERIIRVDVARERGPRRGGGGRDEGGRGGGGRDEGGRGGGGGRDRW